MAAPYKAVRLGKCIPLLQLFPIGVDDRVLIRIVEEKPIEVLLDISLFYHAICENYTLKL